MWFNIPIYPKSGHLFSSTHKITIGRNQVLVSYNTIIFRGSYGFREISHHCESQEMERKWSGVMELPLLRLKIRVFLLRWMETVKAGECHQLCMLAPWMACREWYGGRPGKSGTRETPPLTRQAGFIVPDRADVTDSLQPELGGGLWDWRCLPWAHTFTICHSGLGVPASSLIAEC